MGTLPAWRGGRLAPATSGPAWRGVQRHLNVITMNIGSYLYEIGGLGEQVRRWEVVDAIRGDGDGPFWYIVLESGQYRMVCHEDDLAKRVREQKTRDELTGPSDIRDKGRWRRFDPRKRGLGIVEAEPDSDFAPLDRRVVPTKVSNLVWERTRSLKEVNAFLDHPALGAHDLGGCRFITAMFVARSPVDDSIVGVVVLQKPASRELDDWEDGGPHNGGSGTRIEVKRLAALNGVRPMNSASWMLARAARWADQQGFDVIQAYAGMAGNRGTCYDAAGFDLAAESTARGNDWNSAESRNGRVQVADGSGWERRRWERGLN